jgi:hypothetical protein
MFFKEREARTSEARLRREAELRESASHILMLVTQRRFEEADQLAANLPLNKPSIEIAAELRALGDWHALNGRWPEAAARFQSLLKVNQRDEVDLIAADHLRLAAAFLKSENRDGYEKFRQAQVARLGLTNIASEYWTFKIGLLLPPDPNMLQWFVSGVKGSKGNFRVVKRCARTRLMGCNGRKRSLYSTIGGVAFRKRSIGVIVTRSGASLLAQGSQRHA